MAPWISQTAFICGLAPWQGKTIPSRQASRSWQERHSPHTHTHTPKGDGARNFHHWDKSYLWFFLITYLFFIWKRGRETFSTHQSSLLKSPQSQGPRTRSQKLNADFHMSCRDSAFRPSAAAFQCAHQQEARIGAGTWTQELCYGRYIF